MEREPRISVIMSVYNSAPFLREAVESILNQTYTNFEFLITDDNSNDESLSILESYDDDRIIIIRNNFNIGLTKNLNKLIRLAKGEFIARMDADDISLPMRFDKQIEFFQENHDIVLCGTQICDLGTKKKSDYPTNPDEIKFDLLWTNPIAHPTVMWRRQYFKKTNMLYDENYKSAQDYELWSRVAVLGRIANLKEILLLQRKHVAQVSHLHSKDQNINSQIIKINQLNKIGIKVNDENMNVFLCAFDLGFKNYRTSVEVRLVDEFMELVEENNKLFCIYQKQVLKKYRISLFFGNRLFQYDLNIFREIVKSKCVEQNSISLKKYFVLLFKCMVHHSIK